MSLLIRRAILQWQSWRARGRICRKYPWQTEIDAEIDQAKRSHGKTGSVRKLEREKRDMMTRALGG